MIVEYLTKEEIKQWRSSLEKITLEEFAARLGKQIEETKKTNDLVDIVLRGKSYTSVSDMSLTRTEKITSIAEKAIIKERQINKTNEVEKTSKKTEKITAKNIINDNSAIKKEKAATDKKKIVAESKKENKTPIISSALNNSQVVFKKALTDREQLVFDFFLEHKNQIVYAKDLASLLSLPRDYVYKYIKNLRAKIEGEKLRNAESGGFILII